MSFMWSGTSSHQLLLFASLIPRALSQSMFPTTEAPARSPDTLCCECTVPTPTIAGCASDPECEAFICEATEDFIRDPLCCDIAWDSQCAEQAAAECPLTSSTTDA